MQEVGTTFQIGEKVRIGARHPDLAAQGLERIEKAGAAARIEMGRDLVEQNEGRDARHAANELRVGQDEADQKRLLLARGGEIAGMSFGPWRTSMSVACGPTSVRPAARSRERSSRRIAR